MMGVGTQGLSPDENVLARLVMHGRLMQFVHGSIVNMGKGKWLRGRNRILYG